MQSVSKEQKLDIAEKSVMGSLKDFQRATVERIDELYKKGQNRILVCDEVGLGKTLIAKGVIAKIAQTKRDCKKLIKIVYICSNSSIAYQNLRKLQISKDVAMEDSKSSRLSMQHLKIFEYENASEENDEYMHLIPLTPETSFRTAYGAGNAEERALMLAILRRIDVLKPYASELERIMEYNGPQSAKCQCPRYEERVEKCDIKSGRTYVPYMKEKILNELLKPADEKFKREVAMAYNDKSLNLDTYLDYVINLCQRIKITDRKNWKSGNVIGCLRRIFSLVSLEKLNPDFVIMDEFQRFKELIEANENDENKMLIDKFFYPDSDLKLLMLSATPYKMYSTREEIEENDSDDHFEEFNTVMKFLAQENYDKFNIVWKDYSKELKDISFGQTSFLIAKRNAENALYNYICRTERDSEKESADLIDSSDTKTPLTVTAEDIKSYIEAQKVVDHIEKAPNVPIDYIKSSPYIFSFMKNYELKRKTESYFKKHPEEVGLVKKNELWIKRSKINSYERIPDNNARLTRLMELAFKYDAQYLLWAPPSSPYYELSGAFKNSGGFTKTLVFSSWEMVPRMIASLVSYEAERRTIGQAYKEERKVKYYAAQGKRYPTPRLNFTMDSQKNPGAMSLFTLIYPSVTLSQSYDPVECLNDRLKIDEIKEKVKANISQKLKKIEESCMNESVAIDKRWYYMAPILLDSARYSGYIKDWFDDMRQCNSDVIAKKNDKNYRAHIDEFKNQYEKIEPFVRLCGKKKDDVRSLLMKFNKPLGRQPDDLLDILANMAIASPANVALRTYTMYKTQRTKCFMRIWPSEVAYGFVKLFNLPESIAIVDMTCSKQAEEAYWKKVLSYCIDGNIQAMLDEYAFMISNGFDSKDDMVENIHETLINSIKLKTTTYVIDTFESFKERVESISGDKNVQEKKSAPMRTNFATAFIKGEDNKKDDNRRKEVRELFNSPFRPFILASTSIGQEGLDFHNYCRRVMHWNLPSNPIDIEQREGRVNRFECLAIRQNIAKRYSKIKFSKNIWQDMIEEAERKEKNDNTSDLIPFWGLNPTEDMIKIERIVPMYPFSKDVLQYERLIKILSLYRLTLGQPRQEELLSSISDNYDGDTEKLNDYFINLSPYYKE